MPIICVDFLIFAEGLDASASEATARSAVSRAYYGAFHRVEAWHETLPQPGHDIGPRGGMHQVLINQLQNPDTQCDMGLRIKSRGIAYALSELKGMRTAADYDLSCTQGKEEAANACAKARALLHRATP